MWGLPPFLLTETAFPLLFSLDVSPGALFLISLNT